MLDEERFDERQLIARGKVGFQTVILTIILLFVSAIFADEISYYVDMGDYFIFLTQIIIAYLSVNLMLHDAYMGIYESGKVNNFMIVLICLFFVMIGVFVFHIINGENILSGNHLMGYGTIIFSSIPITYFIKSRIEKNEE